MGICGTKTDPPAENFTPRQCKQMRKELEEFVPKLVDATCISVYDGDSIRVRAKVQLHAEEGKRGLGGAASKSEFHQFALRLFGIDTPEMKGRNEYEKRCARIARDAVSDTILGRSVDLMISGRGKYGRLLARVYINGRCINDLLIEKKLAIAYDGGKKTIRDYEQLLLKLPETISLLSDPV